MRTLAEQTRCVVCITVSLHCTPFAVLPSLSLMTTTSKSHGSPCPQTLWYVGASSKYYVACLLRVVTGIHQHEVDLQHMLHAWRDLSCKSMATAAWVQILLKR